MSASDTVPPDVAVLADAIRRELDHEPRLFSDIVRTVPLGQYRTLLHAWGLLRRRGELVVSASGQYSRKEPGA